MPKPEKGGVTLQPCVQAETETVGVELFVVMAFRFMVIGTRIEPNKVKKELPELPRKG